MKFQIALISLLASSAAAFSPKPFVTPSTSLVTSAPEHSSLWKPPKRNLEMVAGGAEKAYGEEYYDGTYPYEDFRLRWMDSSCDGVSITHFQESLDECICRQLCIKSIGISHS